MHDPLVAMLDILRFYVSSFWVWSGISIGIALCSAGLNVIIVALAEGIKQVIAATAKAVHGGGHHG